MRTQEVLQACDAAVTEARSVAGRVPDRFRIGYIEYLNISAIPASIARFRSRYKGVQVEQIETPPLEVIDALKQGQLDLGFAVLPLEDPPSLEVRKPSMAAGVLWYRVVILWHPGMRCASPT